MFWVNFWGKGEENTRHMVSGLRYPDVPSFSWKKSSPPGASLLDQANKRDSHFEVLENQGHELWMAVVNQPPPGHITPPPQK